MNIQMEGERRIEKVQIEFGKINSVYAKLYILFLGLAIFGRLEIVHFRTLPEVKSELLLNYR